VRFYGDGDARNYPVGITFSQLSDTARGILDRFTHMLNISVEAPQGTKMTIVKEITVLNEFLEPETHTIETIHLINDLKKYECNYPIYTCKISFDKYPLIATFTYEEIEDDEENS
jgi:hypothetical protein